MGITMVTDTKTVPAENDNGYSKKRFIQAMFSAVAPRYDFLNHLLSFGADIYWRRQAIRLINFDLNRKVLDLASGTGDMALLAVKRGAQKIIAADISPAMLERARRKFEKKEWLDFYRPVCADGECLPLADQSVDAAICAFGIRNIPDPEKAVGELARVLNGSGLLVILEFSRPRLFLFRQVFQLYFKWILPRLGSWISGHHSAYYYLPKSVDEFFQPEAFKEIMEKKGFTGVRTFSMMFGAVTTYCGIKL